MSLSVGADTSVRPTACRFLFCPLGGLTPPLRLHTRWRYVFSASVGADRCVCPNSADLSSRPCRRDLKKIRVCSIPLRNFVARPPCQRGQFICFCPLGGLTPPLHSKLVNLLTTLARRDPRGVTYATLRVTNRCSYYRSLRL